MPKHNNFHPKLWDLLVAVCAIVAATHIPAQLVLGYESLYRFPLFDWLLTVVFAVDMLLHLVRATKIGERSLPGKSKLTGMASWRWFLVDLCAAVPFAAFSSSPLFHLFRLAKMARLAERMGRWQQPESRHPTVVRLALFSFWLVLSAHWIACGWLGLHGGTPGLDQTTNYLRALYWCVTTLTTVGYGDITPATNGEMLYTMMVMLLGVGVYGYVIGNVASLLTNIDPARIRHRELVEKVTAFMRYRRVPGELQRRILNYYEYLWEKRLGYDELAAISDLPPTLRAEVSLFLNQDIIQKVPLFQGGSEEFIRAIVSEMHPVIYMPGDYIIRAGDLGDEMYFISLGTVEVVSPDGTAVYATLTSGDFFGEISLLLDEPRTASVRAVDYCDLYVLGKTSFDHVIARHPTAAAHVRSVVEQRRQENSDAE